MPDLLCKEFSEIRDQIEARSYNSANRLRWVLLGINFAAAASYLPTWENPISWVGILFNTIVGVGAFVFLTKQRNKIIQNRALRKLTGKTSI